MAAILELRAEIEAIIKGMYGIDYLRASPEEANMALDRLNTNDCIAIHIDQTTVNTDVSMGSYIVKNIPTEIFFVYKNISIDQTVAQTDELIDNAETMADEFYDKLIQSAVINDVVAIPGYDLERLEAYKKYDATFSGVMFTCDIPVNRKTYYCSTN